MMKSHENQEDRKKTMFKHSIKQMDLDLGISISINRNRDWLKKREA